LFAGRTAADKAGAFRELALHFFLPGAGFPFTPQGLSYVRNHPRTVNAPLAHQVEGIGAGPQFKLWNLDSHKLGLSVASV
jgi:hypothetical protein